jgi:anti-sigma B factor antagonist
MASDIPFELSASERHGVSVLAVRGEVDVATSPQLHERLEAMAQEGTTMAVVDLTEVSFVDSTALGVLVTGAKRLREGGGDLRLVVTEPHIAKVFTITGLDEVFTIYPTAGAALSA